MNGNEPILKGEFSAMHNSSTCEGGSATTARALPLIAVTFPIMMSAATFRANDAIALTQCLQMLSASLLIRKVSVKFNQIHAIWKFVICKNTKNF